LLITVVMNKATWRTSDKGHSHRLPRWLEGRQNDLPPVEYYHVVFTLPAPIAALAWYNKTLIYSLLFEIAAQTLCTIAADPKHQGAYARLSGGVRPCRSEGRDTSGSTRH
jgi:hypothetical protein